MASTIGLIIWKLKKESVKAKELIDNKKLSNVNSINEKYDILSDKDYDAKNKLMLSQYDYRF